MRERGGPEDAFGDAEHRGGLMRVPERGRDTGFLGSVAPFDAGHALPAPAARAAPLGPDLLSPRPQIASVLSDRSGIVRREDAFPYCGRSCRSRLQPVRRIARPRFRVPSATARRPGLRRVDS